jgi:hypothetical protein
MGATKAVGRRTRREESGTAGKGKRMDAARAVAGIPPRQGAGAAIGVAAEAHLIFSRC